MNRPAILTDAVTAVRAWVKDQVLGQDKAVDLSLCAVLAGGHLLLEGVPGLGKTRLAHALAACLGGSFRRVQMTSDLLPSEITGGLRPTADQRGFQFHPGPLFANVVLADELNRASPRTQSALLEAMAESTVTVDGVSHKLPDPFFVVATQNPHESFGVYPLTESQLDRFLIQIELTYPPGEQELGLYRVGQDLPLTAGPHLPLSDAHGAVRAVYAEDSVLRYAQHVAEATRTHARVLTGLSVRGALAWISASKAWAWMDGRDYITPADLKALATSAIAHRLRLHDEEAAFSDKNAIVGEILEGVTAPR